MTQAAVHYQIGIPEAYRAAAVELYDAAFGAKFGVAIPRQADRLRLLEQTFELSFSIAALRDDQLVGLAGFKTAEGALTGAITLKDLRSAVGNLRGFWAGLILSLYKRRQTPAELLMDGIAVSAEARGQGIGTGLLQTLEDHARTKGYQALRLDVIDTNPDARRLYERLGFVATRSEQFEVLRWLLGFGAVTTLVKPLNT